MTTVLVSVVMPCYNHGRFISASVAGILAQTVRELELIVVDDASTDDSLEIVNNLAKQDARIRVIAQSENGGASRSRNHGIAKARGQFLAFCDADDVWLPHKLRQQMDVLERFPQFGLVYSDAAIIDQCGNLTGQRFSDLYPLPAEPSGLLFKELCVTNFINMQTVLIQRSRVSPTFQFDEGVQWVEDWWQWILLSRSAQFGYDASILAHYRVHSNSTALVQTVGIQRNRFKVGKLNLRTHRDMAADTKSVTFYQMGVCLYSLNHRRVGLRFMFQALTLGIRSPLRPYRLVRMMTRCALQWLIVYKHRIARLASK